MKAPGLKKVFRTGRWAKNQREKLLLRLKYFEDRNAVGKDSLIIGLWSDRQLRCWLDSLPTPAAIGPPA